MIARGVGEFERHWQPRRTVAAVLADAERTLRARVNTLFGERRRTRLIRTKPHQADFQPVIGVHRQGLRSPLWIRAPSGIWDSDLPKRAGVIHQPKSQLSAASRKGAYFRRPISAIDIDILHCRVEFLSVI